jgi:hypothetical protein
MNGAGEVFLFAWLPLAAVLLLLAALDGWRKRRLDRRTKELARQWLTPDEIRVLESVAPDPPRVMPAAALSVSESQSLSARSFPADELAKAFSVPAREVEPLSSRTWGSDELAREIPSSSPGNGI